MADAPPPAPNAAPSTPAQATGNGGAPNGAPTNATTPTVAPPAGPTPEQRLEELHKETKRQAARAMESAKAFKREREAIAQQSAGIAEREKALKEWESLQADKKRNPTKYLAKEYGEDWFTTLNRIKLEGGATPDLIASEVDDKVTGVRKDFDSKIEALEAKLKEKEAQEANRWREEFDANALGWLNANKEKRPLIIAAGSAIPGIEREVIATIDRHFAATAKLNEQGEETPGEVLTAEEASDRMEQLLEKLYQALHKAKSPAAPDAAKQSQLAVSDRPRRSLTTDLGATQAGKLPAPRTERERMQRALAAMEESISSRRH